MGNSASLSEVGHLCEDSVSFPVEVFGCLCSFSYMSSVDVILFEMKADWILLVKFHKFVQVVALNPLQWVGFQLRGRLFDCVSFTDVLWFYVANS